MTMRNLASVFAIAAAAFWFGECSVLWGQNLQISNAGSRIQFVGSKREGSHQGAFGKFSGSFDAGAGKLTLRIDMNSLQTDDKKLTGHLMSPDFFDVRKFPTTLFESTQIRKSQNGTATHAIDGKLTLHGVTRQITIPCNIYWQGDSLVTTGTVSLQRSTFGINYGAGQINEEVPVTFQLTAAPADDAAVTVTAGDTTKTVFAVK